MVARSKNKEKRVHANKHAVPEGLGTSVFYKRHLCKIACLFLLFLFCCREDGLLALIVKMGLVFEASREGSWITKEWHLTEIYYYQLCNVLDATVHNRSASFCSRLSRFFITDRHAVADTL